MPTHTNTYPSFSIYKYSYIYLYFIYIIYTYTYYVYIYRPIYKVGPTHSTVVCKYIYYFA